MPLNSARLWLVATPLGNLGDLSPRAAETLTRADIILAEDTRRTGVLLAAAKITPKRLLSFHEHNESERLPQILAALQGGAEAALVSDAGMPVLSDPGFGLVRACRAAGIKISCVPGPCAEVTAVAASGLPPQPYVFLGFLPRKPGDIRKTLAPYAVLPATLVFFERKDRLRDTLSLAAECLGPREVCVAREMTKTHEEFIFGRLEDPDFCSGELLGEITVVVGPPEKPPLNSEQDIFSLAAAHPDLPPRALAKLIAGQTAGRSAKEIYDLLVTRSIAPHPVDIQD